ncbi:type IV toxin-antitoxin system AbiEi family antitoxin [Curtobacterium sp. MCBD17_032]|uniref:type IV toxin-antitoxin system AbiEi family antitoxin n=1 Tax=Curtobacterium sp. MCBD17_032 TaxID=2175659 RepID=UPI0015E892AE|nr:type IV toxin-antitoxin system AbiEi family antitoxin [Curtobacterium sp. MCBD17_032]
MPSSRLVTTDDWPAAELHAAVLAGELVPVGACWASVAEPQDVALRAASYAWSVSGVPLVAAGRTAAWIWGACSRPPLPHDSCVPAGERSRRRGAWAGVREIALRPADVVLLAGVRVLGPDATALDLLRDRRGFGPADADAVRGLVATSLVDPRHLSTLLAASGRLPMGRQAQRRFREAGLEADGGQPALTR